MERYFILNLLLSLLCALALMALAKSPARLRFYVGITMLVSWLIPWHILHISLPHTMANSPLFALPQIDASNIAMPAINALNNTTLQTNMQINWLTVSLDYLWLVVAAIGLSLFARDVCRYRKLTRAWLANSRLDYALWQTLEPDNTAHAAQYPIRRIASQGPGMATGILHPLIWIDETLQDTEQLRATVLHEVTHIKQNDPRWLWVICILQRLLWWNPIAWWASNYTKQQMELSCDETCQSQMPENSYQQLLIQIMLNQQTTIDKRVVNQPIASIRYGQKFNLKRVLILDEEIQMKKRYNAVIVGLFCLFGWIGLSNATGVVDKVLKTNTSNLTFSKNPNPDLAYFNELLLEKKWKLAEAELLPQIDRLDSISPLKKLEILHAKRSLENIFGKYSEAMKTSKQMLTILPLSDLSEENLFDILYGGATSAFNAKQWDEVREYTELWRKLGKSKNVHIEFLHAMSSLDQSDTPTAIHVLEELILDAKAQHINIEEHWLSALVSAYAVGGNFTKAFELQKEATSLHPSQLNIKNLEQMRKMANISDVKTTLAIN